MNGFEHVSYTSLPFQKQQIRDLSKSEICQTALLFLGRWASCQKQSSSPYPEVWILCQMLDKLLH